MAPMTLRLATLLLAVLALGVPATGGGTSKAPLVAHPLYERAVEEGAVRVIVRLAAPFVPEEHVASPEHVRSRRRVLAGIQATLRAQLRGTDHRVARDFDGGLPFLAIEASPEALRTLGALPGVVAEVHEDALSRPMLRGSVPLINADDGWGAGFDGAGMIVAVLDTGVQKDHDFFAADDGKVVAAACFSSNFGGASSLCPASAETSTEDDSGLPCPAEIDGCDHGTHVAGIAAGSGASFSGVARGAKIIAIQVFSRFDRARDCQGPTPCVLSFTSDQLAALQYVQERRLAFPGLRIAAVNMSLGGGRFSSRCDVDQPDSVLKGIIDILRAPDAGDPTDSGVATVIAAGNDGFTDAISGPACLSSAIPVAASTKADGVAVFTNMASPQVFPNLLFAPGAGIRSAVPPGPSTFEVFSGTSMATPHVAGAFAVLRQMTPTATVNALLKALRATGRPIQDARLPCFFSCAQGGFSAPRINVRKAAGRFAPPNLRVHMLAAPAAAVPGANLRVSARLGNTGLGKVAASTLRLYLSADQVITPGDTLLGAITFEPVAGGSTSVRTTITVQIPAATAPGDYFIGAIADADDEYEEVDEADNTAAIAFRVVLPDLLVPSVTFAPAASRPGAEISVTHALQNTPPGPTTSLASTSGVYLGLTQSFSSVVGDRVGVVSMPPVAAGTTTRRVAATIRIPDGTAPGRYFVLVRANDLGGFAEADTDNNVGASVKSLVVGPDVKPTAASAPRAVAPGRNVSVSYTLRNLGGQAAKNFDVGFALVPQGGPEVPLSPSRLGVSLPAGATLSLGASVTIPMETEPGSYRIRVIADAAGVVTEADESNNTILTAPVSVGPDLRVTAASGPAGATPGADIRVTYTLRNAGTRAPAFEVGFALVPVTTPGDDIPTGPTRAVGGLAAGATLTRTSAVGVPASVEPGQYQVRVIADAGEMVAESVETNNSRTTGLLTVTQP